MNALRKLFHGYKNLLLHRPYTVQAIQTATLMSVGDVVAQCFIDKIKFTEIDTMRTLQYSVVGLAVGPIVGKWYKVMERLYGKESVLKKVATDQLLFSPVFIAILVTSLNLLQGRSLDEAITKVRAQYFDILFTGYQVWPLVQLVNFYFIPLQYRVLLVQAVAVVWNTYLSWKLNSALVPSSMPLPQHTADFIYKNSE